jgi:hypothetical protein
MPALTPSFLMDLESRMSIITEREYDRLNNNLWWKSVARLRPATGRREVVTWLLSTAQIHDQGEGGNISFSDLVSQTTEIVNRHAGEGLKLTRAQLEDIDGGGMDLAAQWSADIGAYMSYWPQKLVTHVMKFGTDAAQYNSYTTKPFFAIDHPLNPFKVAAGVYFNLHTGANAAPIDDSVTPDVALASMTKVFANICAIKMPNGVDPRMLRPMQIFCSPRLFPRAVQLTSAKFLAQVATGGVATGDVEALIKALGFATPVQVDELAGFENDKTWFVGVDTLATSQLGAIVYSEREPFRINYYGTVDQVQLGRSQELEWHCHGRNVARPGHPFLLHKVMPT